jgi:serine/threonine-protein kinase
MSSPGPLPTEFGRYQVLEELGAGAMGVVYLCVDPRLSRPVAIKVMRGSEFMTAAERDQFEKRFRHEAEAAGRLTHPDIVQIYDVGPSWIVMEFLEGQPLSLLLKSGERLSVRRVVQLVARVADAVDYAHRHGIVHRDIKPANIMLLDDGASVKVMDFGVARLEHSNLTALGTVVGSVRYMSPEQMMGERVDGRADVFSVAAVAYELLTGQAPFPGKTITEVVSRVVHGAHVPPRKADQRLPATLDAVFSRAFAPKPADRYPRAADFARDLLEACAPALDLEVAPAAGLASPVRTQVPAPTSAPPAATISTAPRLEPGKLLETLVLADRPHVGRLLVETAPAGARLVVDGDAVTDSAALESGLELPFGAHVVRLSAEGHQDAECVVELSPGHPVVHLQVPLRRAAGEKALEGFLALGGDVAPPRRISGAWPSAPAGAEAGVAIVDAYVRETGEVERVVEVSGEKGLREALVRAVLGWRFRPAECKGAPVAARLRVQVALLP